MVETILVSTCCQADVTAHLAGDESAHQCTACEKVCDVEEVCADCYGTGEVTTMEYVYAGEPHMAPIGTRRCHCQVREYEHDDA